MTSHTSGFGSSLSRGEPDAHGQAALLLAEAILHALVEKGTLTIAEAIAVTSTAAEIKVEVAELAHESRARMERSLSLLAAISLSLKSDLSLRSA